MESATQVENLYHACSDNDQSAVDALLSKGVNINAHIKDYGGGTALHYAVHKWISLAMFQYLLKKGANVNEVDADGNTVLHYAALHTSEDEKLRCILDATSQVNIKNKEGDTPLHCAAQHADDNWMPLTILLAQVPDINALNHANMTPLNIAIARHRYTATRILIEKGAQFNPDLSADAPVTTIPGTMAAVLDFAVKDNSLSTFFLRYLFDAQNKKQGLHELAQMKHLNVLVEKLNLDLDEGNTPTEKLVFYATLKACQLEAGSVLQRTKAYQIRQAVASADHRAIYRALRRSDTMVRFWSQDTAVSRLPISLSEHEQSLTDSDQNRNTNSCWPKISHQYNRF